MVSFRVKKSLDHAEIGLLEGFNSKFPTSNPTPFICGVPPGFHVRFFKTTNFHTPPPPTSWKKKWTAPYLFDIGLVLQTKTMWICLITKVKSRQDVKKSSD